MSMSVDELHALVAGDPAAVAQYEARLKGEL
jgi:hypothetical protein